MLNENDKDKYDFGYAAVRPFEGFSLIELSIVILIIGLIVAGVIGGKKLVTLSNLTKARSLTNSSPVAGIDDLSMWWETTSKKSFDATAQVDGTAISTWYDINPQKPIKNNATQLTAANQGLYTQSAINGLPAVFFDGITDGLNGDYYNFDGTPLVGTSYTMFFVVQPNVSTGSRALMYAIASATPNSQINLRYTNLTFELRHSNGGAILLGYTTTLPVSTPRIHSLIYSANNINIYENGKFMTTGTFGGYLDSYASANISSNVFTGTQFSGYMGEIIVFTRDLSDFERQQVEQYLSKKWGIKLV